MATDQPDFSDGTMLALYPEAELADRLAVDGGLPASELHVTVAYTGHADEVDPARLRAAAEVAARRQPFTARLSGHARFTSGKQDVIVALVDSADLEQLRRDTVDALTEQGVEVPADHGFTAHMTLAYVDPDDADPVGRLAPTDMPVTALSVVHGTDRTDLPLDDGLAALAREAYAMGWAASGGPMTDRVKAGCAAAIQLALANADQPGILEATLQLGHLEGIWAAVYERREALHKANEDKLRKAWKKLDLAAYAPRIVRAYRRRLGLTAEATADATWLTALLQQYADDGLTSSELADIKATIKDALQSAAAEGQAGTLAVSADQIGQVGFDFNVAFNTAYDALANADQLLGDDKTSEWLATLLGDQASEVGATLSRLTREGASAADMQTAVEGILSGADSRALLLGTDVLTSRAMSQGALDLYRSEGLEQVDYVTAGDQRVCQQCEDAEENGPYLLADAPIPGLHPLCRCTLAPTVPLPGDSIDRFINGPEGDLTDEEVAAAAEAPAAAATAATAATAGEAPILAVYPQEARDRLASGYDMRAATAQRQVTIDAAMPIAKALSTADQLLENQASERAFLHTLESHRKLGVPDKVIDPLVQAVKTGDQAAIRKAIDDLGEQLNLTQIGKTGDTVAYNPNVQEKREGLRAGQAVDIARPGYSLQLDGETIVLNKPEVYASDKALPVAPPPDTRSAEVKAAQARQADIDAAKGAANAIADLHMFIDNADGVFDDGWKSAVNTHIDRWADKGVITADEADAMRTAVAAGDASSLESTAAQIADRANLTQVGKPGDVVTMDRTIHTGEDVRNGDTVRIFRPGYSYTRGDETITIAKAEVESTDAMLVPTAAQPYHLNLDGIEDLARAVESGVDDATYRDLLGGASAYTRTVVTDDGTTVVRKASKSPSAARAKRSADAEQAASMLGRALGLNVPAVYRTEADAVWMEYVNAPSVEFRYISVRDDETKVEDLLGQVQQAIDSDRGVVAGLFDLMTTNGDRNTGNWLLDEAAQPDDFELIDHGNSFPAGANQSVEPPPIRMDAPEQIESTARGPFARSFVDGEVDEGTATWAENNLTPADIAAARRKVEGLRADFVLLGQEDWITYALRVLDAIEPYATGTRNLIAEG